MPLMRFGTAFCKPHSDVVGQTGLNVNWFETGLSARVNGAYRIPLHVTELTCSYKNLEFWSVLLC